MIPFLTIFTRCCKRPKMLARNLASVRDQLGSVPLEQLLVVDRQHRGLRWANERFHVHRDLPRGEYVYPADDDHWFENLEFVRDVRAAAERWDYPDVMLVRIYQRNPEWRILPPPMIWDVEWESGERPALWVGAGTNVVVKSEVWRTNAWRYYAGQGDTWKTGGDWFFITGLLGLDLRIVRADTMGVTGERSKGEVDGNAGGGWFERATADFSPDRIAEGVWRMEYA